MARTALVVLCLLLAQATAFHSQPRFGRMAKPLLARRKGADLFDEIADIEGKEPSKGFGAKAEPASTPADVDAAAATTVAVAPPSPKKVDAILEPEVTFFEGGPSWTEIVAPTFAILTVVGIIPFVFSLARQAWVRYTVTSRRISVQSGLGGKDFTEITYDEFYMVKYVYRSFGTTGDMVIELIDGSKLEVRSLPDFDRNYAYLMSKVSAECRERSDAAKDVDITPSAKTE